MVAGPAERRKLDARQTMRRLRSCHARRQPSVEASPPELSGIPEDRVRETAAVALQAFLFNVFGCTGNLVWVRVEELQARRNTASCGGHVLTTNTSLIRAARLTDEASSPNGPLRKPNADRCEGAVEADGGTVGRIDAFVHRAKEEIGAIAKTDFGVGIANRQTSHSPMLGTVTDLDRAGGFDDLRYGVKR